MAPANDPEPDPMGTGGGAAGSDARQSTSSCLLEITNNSLHYNNVFIILQVCEQNFTFLVFII